MYLWLLLLPMTLFVRHVVPLLETSEDIVSFSLSKFFCQFFYLIWFDISPSLRSLIATANLLPKIRLALSVNSMIRILIKLLQMISVNSMIRILIKLLQMIWGLLSSFVVSQSLCISVFIFERNAFHTIMVLYHLRFILVLPKGHHGLELVDQVGSRQLHVQS